MFKRNIFFSMRSSLLYFIFISFLFFTQVQGQTQENPWLFSINSNLIVLDGDAVESRINLGAPAFSLSRNLFGGISLGTQYALGTVENFEELYNYTSVDGFLKINLIKGSVLPYVIGGYGFSRFSDENEKPGYFPSTETSRTLFGGVGISINFSEQFAFNLQSTYRSMNENDGFNHFQNFVGLSYLFGAGDADGDGVSDKKDQCPNVPGLKEYKGCPDTDGDTIIDKEDQCPEIPGLPEFKGCIDTDGDGIADPEDNCPEAAGTLEMNGCPDTDGDGIADSLDECITVFGPEENNGCPWPDSDGDGVNDREDLCKDEAGTIENNGCPELSNEIISTLNEFGARINFAANSYLIFGLKTLENLEKIKTLLMENPEGSLLIEGYASADGEEDYNNKLSVKRAEAVRDHLISIGVPASRLEIQGFGALDPIESNENPKGRAINRRVQFKSKIN